MTELNEFNQPVGKLVANWEPSKRPTMQKICGEYCVLEPINISKHANKLFENLLLKNNGESWTYLPYGPFHDYGAFINWLNTIGNDNDTLMYAIIDTKTTFPVGIAAYLRINPEHGSIEVGHLHYSKLLKKSPAATEAMFLMMSNAFDNFNYRRYEWKCNALNQASCNAALRLGFKFEGIFRQCNVYKNRNRDTAWYSIIDSEWPIVKNKFKKWLNQNNFDAHGHQITRFQDI